jgi:hypothetical protein
MRLPRRCRHDNGHSAVGKYLHETGQLRFVLVCDACGAERGDVDSIAYRPHPQFHYGRPVEPYAPGGIT